MANASESTTSKAKHVLKILFMLAPVIVYTLFTVVMVMQTTILKDGYELAEFTLVTFFQIFYVLLIPWLCISIPLIVSVILYVKATKKQKSTVFLVYMVVLLCLCVPVIFLSSCIIVFPVASPYFGTSILNDPAWIASVAFELLFITVVLFFTIDAVRKMKKLKKQEEQEEKE